MIQPVSVLTPETSTRGRVRVPAKKTIPIKPWSFEKKLAVGHAGGVSLGAAAITSLIARTYTTTWKNAGLFGVGAGLLTMMFMCPGYLYKSGINTYMDNN